MRSDKGAHEVCLEFFKGSALLDDKAKIADIAIGARRFAVGRRHESGAQRFLLGMYLGLGGAVTIAAAVFKVPLLMLAWAPHTLMTFVIANLATTTRPYASRLPPIFKADAKICSEVQRYLEHEEFGAYRVSLEAKPQPEGEKPEYWYRSLVKTEVQKVN